jgi:hypothetical protein
MAIGAVRVKTFAATGSIAINAGIDMGAAEMMVATKASAGGWCIADRAERVIVGCWI